VLLCKEETHRSQPGCTRRTQTRTRRPRRAARAPRAASAARAQATGLKSTPCPRVSPDYPQPVFISQNYQKMCYSTCMCIFCFEALPNRGSTSATKGQARKPRTAQAAQTTETGAAGTSERGRQSRMSDRADSDSALVHGGHRAGRGGNSLCAITPITNASWPAKAHWLMHPLGPPAHEV